MRELSGSFVGEESSEKEIIVNLCQEFYRLGWMTGSIINIFDKVSPTPKANNKILNYFIIDLVIAELK